MSTTENSKKQQVFMVFDTKSIGEFGEVFAVGWVIMDRTGRFLADGEILCHPDKALGVEALDTIKYEGFLRKADWMNLDKEDRLWVNHNVVPAYKQDAFSLSLSTNSVRTGFTEAIRYYSNQYRVTLVTESVFPSKALFLVNAISEDRLRKKPFPANVHLLDLRSMLFCMGMDPFYEYDRLPNELPRHNALCDAYHIARVMMDVQMIAAGSIPPTR